MEINVGFGKCLKFFISALDIKCKRLAMSINVDPSLVYRWINGDRVPPYNSHYIKQISEYLSKSISNSIQYEKLMKYFSSVGLIDKSKDVEGMINAVLLEAQGISVEQKKVKSAKVKNKNADMNTALKKNEVLSYKNMYNDELASEVSLSGEDKLIFGCHEVLGAIIKLLKSTPDSPDKVDTICCSFSSSLGVLDYDIKKIYEWEMEMYRLLKGGWKVVYLIRLDNNTERLVNFIRLVRELVKTGRLLIYYYRNNDNYVSEKDIVIVPEIGALVGNSMNMGGAIDFAYYFKSIHAINAEKRIFKAMINKISQPLISVYNNLHYHELLIKEDNGFGKTILYNKNFGNLTVPKCIYKNLISRKFNSNREIEENTIMHDKLYHMLMDNLELNYQTEIYSDDAVDIMINQRKIYLYGDGGIKAYDIEISEIIEYLKYIINLLQNYPKYNIIFQHMNTRYFDKKQDVFFLLKEREKAYANIYRNFAGECNIQIYTEEPLAVYAVHEYLRMESSRRATFFRYKDETIEYLKNRIRLLRKMINIRDCL